MLVMLDALPLRKRLQRYAQINRILRNNGYDPDRCEIAGYEDEHGVTWWTNYEDGLCSSSATNYIHTDGYTEFYGAVYADEQEDA